MIRFSAALVVVAIGVLVGGMATSHLLLVYVAIGLSVVALLALAFGVALKREEIFGERGQLALAGQGANAGFGQERPEPAAAAERSAAPGKQDVFGQQAAALGQTTWAAAPDVYSGRPSPSHSDGPQQPTSAPRTGAGAPWSPSAPATPEPKSPPWRERFAAPVPQQPAAQTRVDTARIRVDLAKTRTDLTGTKADPAGTKADLAAPKADLTEMKADLAEMKADTASDRPTELSWFERIAPVRPAGESSRADTSGEPPASPPGGEPVADGGAEDHDDDIKAEDAGAADSPVDVASVDEADAPAGDVHAEDVTGENAATNEDKATGEDKATDTAEDKAADEDAATDTAEDEAPGADATVDTAAEGETEPSAVGPDAEPEAEDSVPAEASDSSPDGDQEDRSGQREVTVVPGVPRYHDARCILIRFMGDDDLQKMTLDEATEAGCTPCRACMHEHT